MSRRLQGFICVSTGVFEARESSLAYSILLKIPQWKVRLKKRSFG